MSALDWLRGLGVLQVALAVAGLGWAALGGAPAWRVRWGRRLLLLALVLPVLAQVAPWDAPWTPPVHVWARTRDHAAPLATLTLPGEATPRLSVPALPALNLALILTVALATVGGLGLIRLLWGARPLLGPAVRWRRIRGVDLLVSPAVDAPCTLWLGRPVIVLDPDTFADPDRRLLAVQHELQHQRAGDTAWAWVQAGVGVLSFANPVAAWWRRAQADVEELACDAALLARGVPARAYAELLHTTAVRATARPFPGLVTEAHTSLLQRRVHMLLYPGSTASPARAPLRLALVLPLLLGAALLSDRAIADRRVSLAEVAEAAATTSTALPVVANEPVRAAVEAAIGSPGGQRWVRRGLEGYAALGPGLEQRLRDAGLPPELSAVVLVESGYQNLTGAELSPSIPAHQRGAGYWMFIPSTAREYGLRVDGTVDERLDLDRETGAAIDLLDDLHAQYGDWGLALAAYNQGPNKVDQAIRQGGTRDVWALQQQGLLNDYVAQVMAAVLVLRHPEWVD